MKNRIVKRILAAGLVTVMAVSMLAGCGGSQDGGGKDTEFEWWIHMTDGAGEHYEKYEESPVAQYVNAQYWDVENGGIGDEKSGKQLKLSYLVPIAGNEQDNFNTMIGTGEYPELIDLQGSTESAQSMYESGILMDITEYVEKYMPNYLALLDEYPELKPLVSVEKDGKTHYYALYSLRDGVETPWEGTCYRRDWVVKYAEPSEYVWDWESDYVKENGHPAVTPMEKAVQENNLEGWKKNEVTKFEADYGANPNEDYTDNVIFPSGTSDPLTISDWEWMFTAFEKAIADRGWSDNSSAFSFSVAYSGYFPQGDLVSSFGGANGSFYAKDGKVTYSGSSENFKTYVECLHNWYEKGWLDSEFATRAADMFFQINATGTNQGMVGMWCGMTSMLGTAIRTTCANAEDAEDAFTMGCALPINDVYGGDEQKFKDPDAFFMASRTGAGLGITKKAEKKDLATLFTYLDWTYTPEGGRTIRFGLNEEQYKSVKLDPDLLAKNNLTCAYTEDMDETGKPVYTVAVDESNTLANALRGQRMDVGLFQCGTEEYSIDKGFPMVNQAAITQWQKYVSTANVGDYKRLLNAEETESYDKVQTAAMEYQYQKVPELIKNGLDGWDAYVEGLEAIDPDSVAGVFDKFLK